MFVMDMPDVPPQYAPIVVAQKSQVAQKNTDRTIGICHPIENMIESRLSAINAIEPVTSVYSYLKNVEHRVISDSDYQTAKITLLQATTHGELLLFDSTQSGRYLSADYSYSGSDRATVLVEIGGYKVKVMYYFELMQSVPGSSDQGTVRDNKTICPNGPVWKITFNPEDLNAPIYSIQNPYQLMSSLAEVIGNINFADLPSGAVGQTTGTTITLDDNAAGYGWFIDSTPNLNEEWLPTSNPNEWVAKTGSAAYGKMDMLSVLLHEYGHALGIEHSADQYDFMGTTLTAGVRRLPSAEELALMQQLVSDAKIEMATVTTSGSNTAPTQLPLIPLGGFGLAFLGRLRSSRYGSSNVFADYSTLSTQFEVTANAKLTNGTFVASGGLPPNDGWATQGSVDFTAGKATLQEITTSQTRLNQVLP